MTSDQHPLTYPTWLDLIWPNWQLRIRVWPSSASAWHLVGLGSRPVLILLTQRGSRIWRNLLLIKYSLNFTLGFKFFSLPIILNPNFPLRVLLMGVIFPEFSTLIFLSLLALIFSFPLCWFFSCFSITLFHFFSIHYLIFWPLFLSLN